MGGSKRVVLTTNKEFWYKLVLMHQASLCAFQRELKFGTEDQKWR